MISPVEIRVSSRRRWVHTGFPLVAGATYRIEVPPGQHWWDLYIRYGPEGGVTGPLQRGLADKLRVKGHASRKAEYFTLIGTIGESIEHAFVIGAGPCVFTAPISGELVCFANDLDSAYWNNFGSMKLSIVQTV